MDFQCGYCEGSSNCSISQECADPQVLIDGQQCPPHIIDDFSPSCGPPNGETLITIYGTRLGTMFDSFNNSDSIMVGDLACTPRRDDYVPGRRISCLISGSLEVGPYPLAVTLTRVDGSVSPTILAKEDFMVVRPTLSSVEPGFGPIAGGSMLRIRGTGLDIGNDDSVRVILDRDGAAGMCEVM